MTIDPNALATAADVARDVWEREKDGPDVWRRVVSAVAMALGAGTPARARANAELGARFAKLLAEPHAHQLGVCAKLRIPWRSHMRWMSAEAAPGSDLAEYQSRVLEALDKARVSDLEAVDTAVENADGSRVGTVWNVRKHRHESRFKRFYDDAQKIEITHDLAHDLKQAWGAHLEAIRGMVSPGAFLEVIEATAKLEQLTAGKDGE